MMDLDQYVGMHTDSEPDYLRKIERDTNRRRINGRMCSGHVQGRLLTMLTRMIAPKKALELGTFTGYSALCIAEGLPESGKLLSIEADDELEEVITRNLESSPLADKVRLKIGKALDVCAELPSGDFDMIFIDADKREYPLYYEEAKRLLRPGGYIIADNTLWDGNVIIDSKHDRQTEGIRRFNESAVADPEVEVVILPIRDGLSIIRKRN